MPTKIHLETRHALRLGILVLATLLAGLAQAGPVDFNTDIRRILSDNCFRCHGPDEGERKGGGREGLRLDKPEGATADLGGYAAVVPGEPEESEVMRRVTATDRDELMPPPETGHVLSQGEIDLLRAWIREGAVYARHWAYVKPARPELPEVQREDWPRNAVDYFILNRLEQEGLSPSEEASRSALARRVSLDLTGLPPTLEEVDAFAGDREPGAYERLVDRLLKKESFGEHWARLWLDQARYADSTGYADDPPRTIWAYRDYVIQSLNANKPFDRFTIEQIAGDLLPEPTEEQLVATAFHRNTQTNNEGGTNDEEYRNVAVVDRVNTTMEVWMGTTMACAQCHSHKFDPISQEDYFRLFAILNNTADADRRDERPILELFTDEQKMEKARLQGEIKELEGMVSTTTPELARAQREWQTIFSRELEWQTLEPLSMQSEAGAELSREEGGVVRAERKGEKDVYTLQFVSPQAQALSALRLEALSDPDLPGKGPGHAGGNFVLSRVRAFLSPEEHRPVQGRYVRVSVPGKDKILSLAEVQVFEGESNVAQEGEARQSSTGFNGPARLAIDGNTDGDYAGAKSTTHTAISEDPWWELDLGSERAVDRLVLWNRTDGGFQKRLSDFRVVLLNEAREVMWETGVAEPPDPQRELSPGGTREIVFSDAWADHEQKKFPASSVLSDKGGDDSGWAVGGAVGRSHELVLVSSSPVEWKAGETLKLRLEHQSKHAHHTLGKFRLTLASDENAAQLARTPAEIQAWIRTDPEKRTAAQQAGIEEYYLSVAPLLERQRERLAGLRRELEGIKPYTTVPILRELSGDKRRMTHVQRRGNFLDRGAEVGPGLPGAFHELPEGPAQDRLALAQWLVDTDNPLTARVLVNRFWESIFGRGIVKTSEEFGSQGELPSHPRLLDWLAVELMEQGWDLKHLLKLMVTSATYRQSPRVDAELLEKDPENRWLARGPRFRMSAEMIRDQALFVSGLLSRKMYGPPVRPFQPKMNISAAFGSGIDWKTSEGEDRFRRGIYTTWRRSNPYPSMAAFDAPSREVCVVKRDRTNTPLQALVTLNDPVYVEASQALGRRMARAGSTPAAKARHGFRLCLAREPGGEELGRLLRLFGESYARFAVDAEGAKALATNPIGPVPPEAEAAELAAWTVVGNVLLNLDETLMKR